MSLLGSSASAFNPSNPLWSAEGGSWGSATNLNQHLDQGHCRVNLAYMFMIAGETKVNLHLVNKGKLHSNSMKGLGI